MNPDDWLWFTGLISISCGLILLEMTSSIRYAVLSGSGLLIMLISLIFRFVGEKRT